jgi:RHS repeat-associated protein
MGTVTDARNNTLLFNYAPCCQNKLTSITYPDSSTEQFTYDGVKHVTNYVNRAGQVVKLTYDDAERLAQKEYVGVDNIVTIGYDPANQLTGAVWEAGETNFSQVYFDYDAAGRLTNETQQVLNTGTATTTKTVGYEYYADGRRKKLVYPDGSFITYEYNSKGWLTAIKDSGTSTIVGYEYNDAGRRTKRTLENSSFTVYDYDNADQLTNVWHRQVRGTTTNTISRYQYGYDDAGNRRYMKRASGQGDVYGYDAADQLTSVRYEASNPDTNPSGWSQETQYFFDAAGNRTNITQITSLPSPVTNVTEYAPNSLNEYSTVGGTSYTYDAKGNLTGDGIWTFTYDYENRLTCASNATKVVTYLYDAFGRLVRRQVNASSPELYFYAGWQMLAEYNGYGSLQRKYVYGPGIDEPVRMTSGEDSYWYHADGLGSVTEMTDGIGDGWESYTYDVYGTPTIWSDGWPVSVSVLGNRLMFTGRDHDPDTGLYNYRYRYYSPALGRFVQPDPINIAGGDLNLYTYVWNDPGDWVDPLGWKCVNTSPPKGFFTFAGGTIGFLLGGGLSFLETFFTGGGGVIAVPTTLSVSTVGGAAIGASIDAYFATPISGKQWIDSFPHNQNKRRHDELSKAKGPVPKVKVDPETGEVIDPESGEVIGGVEPVP